MKNMKVSVKIILAVSIAVVFLAITGIAGIIGMTTMDAQSTKMYYDQTVPITYISQIMETLQSMRSSSRDYIIGAATNDNDLIQSARQNIETNKTIMTDALNNFEDTITPQETQLHNAFNEARTLYDGRYMECLDTMYNMAINRANITDMHAKLGEYTRDTNTILEKLYVCKNLNLDSARKLNYDINSLSTALLITIISILLVAIAVSITTALKISGMISKPLKFITAFMKQAGKTGAITLSSQDAKVLYSYAQIKDEIGECIDGCVHFVRHVNNIADELETVSKGDLTTDVEVLSDDDIMGLALRHTVDNLNEMFGEINMASTQVSVGAGEVASGAHSLAQGSTEQAASVEQLSASINEISEKTKENANMAGEAAKTSSAIRTNAEKGSGQMDRMMKAVNEINEASQSISKIIKTIDDIAFQTNILALNAAVEAARAGQHGKGFAVVAEEVRNLASKSAQAAHDTSAMIESSVEKSNLGLALATQTAESLKEIVEGVIGSTDIIHKIADSSDEQTLAVSQIHIGIDQVSQVIQQSSATAEQSAAASQEMSGQATLLSDLVKKFRLKKDKIKL